MNWSNEDEKFMRGALEEARCAGAVDEVPVGALIVSKGQVIGHGFNRSVQDNDPTAHAEIVAMRAAAASRRNYRLVDTTLYVTLEPCVMCVGAMLHARISRLVFGAYDPKAGAAGSVIDLCSDRKFNHIVEVNGGLYGDQCGDLLKTFFQTLR